MLKISFARYEIKEDIALSIIQTNLFQKHQEISFCNGAICLDSSRYEIK